MSVIEINYYTSPLGVLKISVSDEAVTGVHFTAETELAAAGKDIIGRPPASEIIKECIVQLENYFEGRQNIFNIPVHFTGTSFQNKVWEKLCEIPFGRTVSYMDLSKKLGDPKAIRAVGTANGRNPLAIIVPCHRVIGSNGTLVGYAGELWRKKWLLDHESKFANGLQKLF